MSGDYRTLRRDVPEIADDQAAVLVGILCL